MSETGGVRVGSGTVPPVSGDAQGARSISPTDVAQFIRLDQCERYLRLRLHERAVGPRFLYDFGVVPQSLTPLLTRSGAAFEQGVERAVSARHPTTNFAALTAGVARPDNNAQVAAEARALAPGQTLVLLQVRLHVSLAGWRMRGDLDILRLERSQAGELRVLIADMKSSRAAKVEHRLQVAFYVEMLGALFAQEGIACAQMAIAILYRGPTEGTTGLSQEEQAAHEAQRAEARSVFGVDDALLELVPDPQSYRALVRDLVTDPRSVAARVAAAPFEALPYALTYKCDDCLYNEYCMKWSAEHDDLSLLPHVSANDKTALRRCGVTTTRELAAVKIPLEVATNERDAGGEGDEGRSTRPIELIPASGKEELARRLAATWPIGPRLDELAHRARRYRKFKGDQIAALSYIPSKGYGSLPYCDAEHNPNLVRVYIDAQHDYLNDRLYLLGSLVVASERGEESPERRRAVVRLADGPPDTPARERELLVGWIEATLRAVAELAAPDAAGQPAAPIHLIFFDRYEQRVLLDALARHFAQILSATPLYDFLTQLAAFDSPLVTFLDTEIRELKNYPMVCQSLQAVAAYLKFDWNSPAPYRTLFSARHFDFWGKLNQPSEAQGVAESPWYTARARFGSQIPLEYAYAVWGELNTASAERRAEPKAELARYRAATPELLAGFHARRLEAMEHIAKDFRGNERTTKTTFTLPTLGAFEDKARTLAQALDEFVTIERHVELGVWKTARLAPPERRVLSGDTLLARYCEAYQDPDMAARNRENARRDERGERYRAEYRAEHPDAKRIPPNPDKGAKWSPEGIRLRLRLETDGVDCALDEALAVSDLRAGERVALYPRWTVDERLPADEQTSFTPTPKQLLYGMRADIGRIVLKRDAAGHVVEGFVEVEMAAARGGAWSRGFVFGGKDRPLVEGQLYTLDSDPNSWYGYDCAKVVEGLVAGSPNTLYERLCDPVSACRTSRTWPREAADAQARFLAGLDAFERAGELHDFEPSKREYIAEHGATPTLVVQGPPGTGKSYTTGFAVFARLQGALAADLDMRVFVSCKTHAATDVLLKHIADVRERLRLLQLRHPELFARSFDPRLLEIPLFRVEPKAKLPDVITVLPSERARGEQPKAYERVAAQRHCVVGAPPGKIHRLLKDRFPNELFGHYLCGCLILDEASQMNLPEAMMAALPLAPDGQLIVVGDHRQMPPIVKHDWAGEPRRTFQEYRAYESLFATLLSNTPRPPLIQFAESFRLHADMASFLRREVYARDGIPYHSRQHETLPVREQPDPFVASVLAPAHPLVVVVHDEAESMLRNPFELELLIPVLRALADPTMYNLDPKRGLGVVVPHRAQKAALQEALPRQLTVLDPTTGAIALSAVDTVERFQGDERAVILVSATESDPQYLLAASAFLLDPRRLTVALSRAKQKMILVASRSVFTLCSADEETFAHAQLWKNVLRHACTVKLWEGERGGQHVEVWGNAPGAA